MIAELTQSGPLRGEVTIPGDKSISHRAVMFGSIADGLTEVDNFLGGADCLSTIDCFQRMGIEIERKDTRVLVHGRGLHGLKAPSDILYTGNSGTTTRLISGILAAQKFDSVLDGDASIRKRPMARIMKPLGKMGAHITSIKGNDCAPLKIEGRPLCGIHYKSMVASAQVKSAVLLAGLYADGETSFTEPSLSRNHTELMLSSFGAEISTHSTTATVWPCERLGGQHIKVPGDISSAAYFIAAALLVPGSELLIKNVGINPTRAGILKVCRSMGADITLLNTNTDGEPSADLLVKASLLSSTIVEGSIIPTLIDELPIIAVMAAFARGTTIIRDASELKVKESNRIEAITENLRAMGADVIPMSDGLIIKGGAALHGAEINSHLDHRIAMSFAVASLVAPGTTTIHGSECVDISYPGFYEALRKLADN